MTFHTLIAGEQLVSLVDAAEANDLVVLDCQTDLMDATKGYADYCAGHIPGALHADLDTHGAGTPGAGGRHPLPEASALLAQMRRWGIHNYTQVAVYDRAGGAFAARFWWCLRWLGHAKVALLDGGLDGWLNAYPGELETGVDGTRPGDSVPGTCTLRPALTRTISAQAISERISHVQPQDTTTDMPSTNLLDARTQERFDGLVEPIDPIAGHIPGAACLPFQQNLTSNGRFLPAAELALRFAGTSDAAAGDPVCYCGSGVTAAHNVLAMVHAGYAEPLLYPGSWSEWIVDPKRPRQPTT